MSHNEVSLCEFPQSLVAGDSLTLRVASDEYPAEDFDFRLVLFGPETVQFPDPEEDLSDDGVIQMTSAATAELEDGYYSWAVRAYDEDGERHTVAQGMLEVLPDPADAEDGAETRSFAARALAGVETLLLSKSEQTSFSVFGRSVSFETRKELLDARERYRREVRAEQAVERQKLGRPSHSVAKFRF